MGKVEDSAAEGLKRLQQLEKELDDAVKTDEAAKALRERVVDTRVMPPRRQVVQLVRNIGAVDSPDTMAVDRVNAELAQMLMDGWTLHTVRTLGVLPGGVSVYYCFVK